MNINEEYNVTSWETDEDKFLLIERFKDVEWKQLQEIAEANDMPAKECTIMTHGWISKPQGEAIALFNKENPKAVLRWRKEPLPAMEPRRIEFKLDAKGLII